MLLNDLYTIESCTENDQVLLAAVKLNSQHAIFKGHFPGQPVLPGVCMLEMIREIMEEFLQQKLRISKGPLIKFLTMIVPEKNTSLLVEINRKNTDGVISVNGKIFHETTTFMKYHLELVPVAI